MRNNLETKGWRASSGSEADSGGRSVCVVGHRRVHFPAKTSSKKVMNIAHAASADSW